MTEEKKKRPIKPAVWEHKESKKQCRVMPWWETVPGETLSDQEIGSPPECGSPWKFGMLIQVGWLMETENGIFIGVGPTARDAFNVISEGSYE